MPSDTPMENAPAMATRWRYVSAGLAMAALLLGSPPVLAQKTEYTALKGCPEFKGLRLPDRVVTSYAERCKAPKGYTLYIVGEDVHSFVVIGWGKNQLFETQPFVQLGQFPNIGEAPAEWRLNDSGQPYALIVRQQFQDNANPEQKRSRLVVFTLQPKPRFVGDFATNAQAREAADVAGLKPQPEK